MGTDLCGVTAIEASTGRIEKTNAIGLVVKRGKYGGTFAAKDIAFEFGSAISVLFKLYLIREFQRLKEDEQRQLGWSAKRELAKINYHIHTDAIKKNLIPPQLNARQKSAVYASEADILNVAMFGMTAAEWKFVNKDKKGNIPGLALPRRHGRDARCPRPEVWPRGSGRIDLRCLK